MSKLDIKIYPDKLLRRKAKPVERRGKEEQTLAYDMIETMRSESGVGLAAPQVGVSKRIIVIEALERGDSPLILINPKILEKSGKSSFCEGCLSVPNVTCEVVRPEKIVVETMNLDGKLLRIETGFLLARIIQHEVDHLDGILFIDRVGFLKRKKILREISPKVCQRL